MPIDLARTQKQFLSLDEFAETVGVSRRTLYNWMHDDHPYKLQTVKIYGSRRIPIEEARRIARVELPATIPATNTPADSVSRSVKSHETTH